jgi:hypothetical protein
VYSCQPADEEEIVATMVRNSACLRRALAVVAGSLLAGVTLLPSAAAAGEPAVSSGTGVVSHVTGALVGDDVEPGDVISSGWTLSIPGHHPAATVQLTDVVATIPLRCHTEKREHRDGTATTVALRFGDVVLTVGADDTGWHPTARPADAQGYQASTSVGDPCGGRASEPGGVVTYQARVLSTDTADPLLLRFHSVDARSNGSEDEGHHGDANVDCSSTTANRELHACSASWTPPTRVMAAALSVAHSPVPAAHSPGARGGGGTAGGAPGQVPSAVAVAPGGAGQSPSAGHAPPVLPVLVLPAPSQPTVLSPVPLVVPVIDGVSAQVAGALPWKWFVVLAIVDLGLIVGMVIRRRHGRIDRLGRR